MKWVQLWVAASVGTCDSVLVAVYRILENRIVISDAGRIVHPPWGRRLDLDDFSGSLAGTLLLFLKKRGMDK